MLEQKYCPGGRIVMQATVLMVFESYQCRTVFTLREDRVGGNIDIKP